MSIFDILNNGSLENALKTLGGQAGAAARSLGNATPGGVGGLLGAGALGAILGNLASSGVMKNVALAGAGALAWNFYQKWMGKTREEAEAGAAPTSTAASTSGVPARIDPTAELVMRSMIYAARADGAIDADERQRIRKILQGMMGDQDVNATLDAMQHETLDPARLAAQAGSPEQAEDIYRLSCSVIDIDHFMERSYLDALANSLGIDAPGKARLEAEASQVRGQLMAALKQETC